MEITPKMLLDLAIFHNNPQCHTANVVQTILKEYHFRNKRIPLDIDAVTCGDPYQSYTVCCFFQDKEYDIDVDNGIVYCTSFQEFYLTLHVILQMIENHCNAHKVTKLLAFFENHAHYDVMNALANCRLS